MTITVKELVERTIEVEPPFASGNHFETYIVTENEVINFWCEGIMRLPRKSSRFEEKVFEAWKMEKIDLDAAYIKLDEALTSFVQRIY